MTDSYERVVTSAKGEIRPEPAEPPAVRERRDATKEKPPLPQPLGFSADAERGLDTRLLRHFLAVVECKGFTTAADLLHITQPALTKSVQKLEHRLGVKLLERHHNIVEPTRYGQILATRAKLIEMEFAHAVSEIQSLKEGLMGTVSVGIGPSFVNFMPKAILALQQERPNVRVAVTVNVMDQLLAGLLAGDLDVICTALEFSTYPDIVKEPLLEGENALIARRDHPLARGSIVEPRELLAYPWVTFSKDYMGTSRIGSFFAASHLRPPKVAVTAGSPDVMFAVLRQSDYLSSIPTALLPNARALGLDELSIRGSFWRVSLGIAYRRATRPTPAIGAFIDILRSLFTSKLSG